MISSALIVLTSFNILVFVIASLTFDVSQIERKSYLYRDSVHVMELNTVMLKEFTSDSIKTVGRTNNPSLVLFYAPVSIFYIINRSSFLQIYNSGAHIVEDLLPNLMQLLINFIIYH